MDFASCLADDRGVLMEGALGERLKREHQLAFDEHVALAGLVYEAGGRSALVGLWSEYADIAPCNSTDLVRRRFWGIQANASRLSPEELDGASSLESSDAALLADDMVRLRDDMGLRVFGGCCGTDGSHLEEIARRLTRRR